MSRRVVITGLGTVNPLGNNVETTWDNVKKGVCGIDEITRIDTTNHAVKLAGEVKNLDVTAVIDKKDARRMDRYAQYAVVAADEAFKQSGLDMEKEDAERCGVIFSSGIGGMEVTEKNYQTGERRGFDKISPFYIPMTIANMGAGNIAIRFGFKGICTCVVTACASGNNAVGDSFHYIRDGYADVMICGGSEAAITDMAIGGFTAMQALNTTTDKNRASIPFDKERAGFVMGEGAGALVLEEYEHAKARGAEILGEVVGYGATCDAYHITSPAEDGSGAAKAMEFAMKDAGITPEQLDYVNAHGTSTHHNDLFETKAIKLALGDHADKVKINSTKSMIGHLLGAAGGVEFITCVKSIEDGYVHPTVGLETPGEGCDLDYTMHEGVSMDVNYAISNSLGFGGHNASLIVKKFTV